MLCPELAQALLAGRQAADILEAMPADEEHGYSRAEEAQQFAAVDRLVEAFRRLDKELTGQPVVARKYARCNACGDEVVFDAWVTVGGEVHSVYDESYCVGCEGSVGSRYTEVEVEE
jgi:hypothetical protein